MSDYVATAPTMAFNNRDRLTRHCGCYACGSIFEVTAITEWTDSGKTAICPTCSCDSVLPLESMPGEPKKSLQEIKSYWFREET